MTHALDAMSGSVEEDQYQDTGPTPNNSSGQYAPPQPGPRKNSHPLHPLTEHPWRRHASVTLHGPPVSVFAQPRTSDRNSLIVGSPTSAVALPREGVFDVFRDGKARDFGPGISARANVVTNIWRRVCTMCLTCWPIVVV